MLEMLDKHENIGCTVLPIDIAIAIALYSHGGLKAHFVGLQTGLRTALSPLLLADPEIGKTSRNLSIYILYIFTFLIYVYIYTHKSRHES